MNVAGKSDVSELVGRSQELGRLLALLEDARAGRGRAALVLGEAGIGKTRLTEAFAAAAAQVGIRVAWGRCTDAESPAYWPWRQLLRGLEVALWDKPRRGGIPKLDERGHATLIALACANPPEGRTCWTMQLLANELVVRQVVPSISDETVRRTLKKTASSRGSRSTGAFGRSARAS
jgi:hypothetical protein